MTASMMHKVHMYIHCDLVMYLLAQPRHGLEAGCQYFAALGVRFAVLGRREWRRTGLKVTFKAPQVVYHSPHVLHVPAHAFLFACARPICIYTYMHTYMCIFLFIYMYTYIDEPKSQNKQCK